ncbi:MAG: TonB-dependent receptor domain-containing protein [Pseudohongiellaceae bacterium]
MKKTSKFPVEQKILASAMLAIFSGMTSSAVTAQDANAAAAAELEEITVTGSRVRVVTGMTAPTPVTAITVAELINFNPGSTVAEQLDNLPQFFSTNTAQRGGNAVSTTAGGSYLNLRGMGQNRTLVLLNGSRIIPADANGSVNIDNFPSALMTRVDVVTGGASAAYGADAVAGVVNFVLDREFEGLKTRVSTGITEEMDGENYNLSVAGGKSFLDGRLHLIGSVDARQIDQIGPDRERWDNWQEWGHVRNPAWVSLTATPTTPQRITVPNVFGAISAPQGLITSTNANFAYNRWVFTNDAKDVRAYSPGSYLSLTGAGAASNQAGGQEYNDYVASNKRGVRGNEVAQRSFFLAAKYDVNDQLSVNVQSIFGRSESSFWGQPSNITIPGAQYQWTVQQENPYLPARLKAEMVRLNLSTINVNKTGNIYGPNLINIYDDRADVSIGQLASTTVGFEYDFENGWNLTGNFQRGESSVGSGLRNIPRIDKFFMAMDAVVDPASGKIVCNISLKNPSAADLAAFMVGKKVSSPLTPDGVTVSSPIGPLTPSECVPFNPFGLGNANLAAKDWIEDEGKKQDRILEQDFAELLLTGQVYEGWGAGPISLAAGLTLRDESFDQVNFPAYGERGLLNAPTLGIRNIPIGFANAGNRSLHPFSAIGVGGGENGVWEWFSEVNVPIWKWDTGQSIGSTLAYRSSNYDKSGRQESWKIGFDAQIVEDLRWRFTKSRDIREPNFAELYLTTTGSGTVIDPVFGTTNSSLTSLGAPNTTLAPEFGNTITSGFVYQPSFATWANGIQLSLDWYEIDLLGAVNLYGNQRIVDDCFQTKAASACNLISRDLATNTITRILNQYINAGNAQTRGVDFEVMNTVETNFFSNDTETFTVRALAGYLAENSTKTAAGTTLDALNSQGRPEYKATISTQYSVGSWGAMLQGTYDGATMNNNTWVEGRDVDDNWIASQTIFSAAANYTGEMSGGGQWRGSFNVTNLFNRAPPIIAGAGGQSFSSSHDTLGRRYQLSLNMDF